MTDEMAKQQRSARSEGDPQALVRGKIQALRQAYRLGQRIVRRFPTGQTHGKHAVAQLAKEHGRAIGTIQTVRVFADRYTQKEMQDLLALCKEHCRAIGLPFVAKLSLGMVRTLPRPAKTVYTVLAPGNRPHCRPPAGILRAGFGGT